MLGFEDGWIALAWWLSLISAIGGVIYGVFKWNGSMEESE